MQPDTAEKDKLTDTFLLLWFGGGFDVIVIAPLSM
jgi:hypothetical protein